jgi:FKBP-type peptidyl-prolyl cis-trans isomerase
MLFLALLALQAASPAPAAPPAAAVVATASGLRYQLLQPGSGRRPTLRDAVLVSYEGRLADGTVFETTDGPVGLLVSDVVPGFSEALRLMNEGGRYRIWIPPELAYGARGAGNGVIPPNAELVFTITLVRVGAPAAR